MSGVSRVLQELVDQIGYGATIDLLRAWGGRRLRVPLEPGEEHPITFTIGHRAAQDLAAFYGGSEIDLPAERNALMAIRNAAIMADLRADMSTRACAQKYGMTPRHVRHIRRSYEDGATV